MNIVLEIFSLFGAILIVAGAFFSLSAAVAQVRFPDVLARMHAATKPQVLGVLLVLVGVMFMMPSFEMILILSLIVLLQFLTAPISSHMVSRTAYRASEWDQESAVVDELRDSILNSGVAEDALPAALMDASATRPPDDSSASSDGGS